MLDPSEKSKMRDRARKDKRRIKENLRKKTLNCKQRIRRLLNNNDMETIMKLIYGDTKKGG